MRVIHTADWHLGQELRGFSRAAEHALFLDWLIALCADRSPDAVVIAGDLFDTANPSAEALGLFARFAERVRAACPATTIIAVAGNHDGAGRFDALAPAMRAGVRLIGAAPRTEDAGARLLIPAGDGHVLAAPYFRLGDLPLGPDLESLADRVGALYARLWAQAAPPGPCLVTGHLTVLGGAETAESERPIFVGGAEAAPLSVFPAEAAYVALGHLHRAQRFAGGRVAYAGSPLPLSAAEIGYAHRVIALDIPPDGALAAEDVPVPRPAPFLRLPETGALAPEAAVDALAARLDAEGVAPDCPPGLSPFVEIHLALDAPRPHVGARLVEEVRRAGLPARILGVHAAVAGVETAAPAAAAPRPGLEALFRAAFAERHGGAEPGAAHLAAFHAALESLG